MSVASRLLLPFASLAGLAARAAFSTVARQEVLHDGELVPLDARRVRGLLFAMSERDVICTIAAAARFGPSLALVAPGNDGDLATATVKPFGVAIARGSSRRDGAAGLGALVKAMRESDDPAVIFVDGPLGPQGSVREGIVLCAKLSGRPIVPAAMACSHPIVFRRSWARHELPLPFTRFVAVRSDAIEVPPDTPREAFGSIAAEVSARLTALRLRAEANLARTAAAHREAIS